MPNHQSPSVIFFPSIVYDVAQFAFFPVNALIAGLCYLQPQKSIWNEFSFETQDMTGSGESLSAIKDHILHGDDIAYHEKDLVRLYDSLPNIQAKTDLVGKTWHGKILRTNASVLDVAEWVIVRPLTKLGFAWGKRYRSQHKGDPLLINWKKRYFSPIPIWGNVGVTDIRWRGEVTATMNYDHQPWKDYFRLLDDKNGKIVLLGVWTHKHIAGGWFTLTLDKDISTD